VEAALTNRLERYRRARKRATAYLLDHLNADGSIGPVEHSFYYYRLPWALAAAGEISAGERLCAWIRSHQFAADGDFVGLTPRPETEYHLYANALLVVGAQMLQQFDLAQGGIDYILRHADPLSGGFYNFGDEAGHSDKEDIPFTCGVGLACLMTGRLDEAEGIAAWLHHMWALQPDLPDRLYFIYSASRQALVTEFPAQEAWDHVLEAQAPCQRFTVGGIAAAFLARLYLARPRPTYLALARNYQMFAHNQTERQFEVAQVCKVGWGAALLYGITGEEILREWAIRVGDYFIETQRDDGSWINNTPAPDLPEIEITSEFAVYLDAIMAVLDG